MVEDPSLVCLLLKKKSYISSHAFATRASATGLLSFSPSSSGPLAVICRSSLSVSFCPSSSSSASSSSSSLFSGVREEEPRLRVTETGGRAKAPREKNFTRHKRRAVKREKRREARRERGTAAGKETPAQAEDVSRKREKETFFACYIPSCEALTVLSDLAVISFS